MLQLLLRMATRIERRGRRQMNVVYIYLLLPSSYLLSCQEVFHLPYAWKWHDPIMRKKGFTFVYIALKITLGGAAKWW